MTEGKGMSKKETAELLRNKLTEAMKWAVYHAKKGFVATCQWQLGRADGIEFALKAISEVSDEESERWKRFDQAVTNYCISHKTI